MRKKTTKNFRKDRVWMDNSNSWVYNQLREGDEE
jgi:hypothetical protein